MEEKKIKKLYYSISEVSQITGLKKYILRYWETEFPDLRPGKNRAGNRIYRLNDIRTIFLIKKLLYQDKYTIEGAKKRLKELKKQKDPQLELSFEELRREDMLREIRKDLRDLLNFLDSNESMMLETEIGKTGASAEQMRIPAGKTESQEKHAAKVKPEVDSPDMFMLEHEQEAETGVSGQSAANFTLAFDTEKSESVTQTPKGDSQDTVAEQPELQPALALEADKNGTEPLISDDANHIDEIEPEAADQTNELNQSETSEGLFPDAAEAPESTAAAVPDGENLSDENPEIEGPDEQIADQANEESTTPPVDPTDAWDDPDKLSK